MKRKSWIKRSPWLGVAALLAGITGPTAQAQQLDPPPVSSVVPISATAPVAPGAPVNRQAALEERVAQLEAELRAQRSQLQRTPAVQAQEASYANLAPAASSAAPAKPGEPYQVGSDLKMSANWKDGLNIESANKDFRVHVGGRTQLDWTGFTPDATPIMGGPVGSQNAVNFRRARLRIDGTCYETMDWCSEWEFSNTVNLNPGVAGAPGAPSEITGNVANIVVPTDVWWNFKELPLIGNIRIGNLKPCFGLEHLTSSRFLDFIERSYIQDAYTGPFNNGFEPGILAYNWTENQMATGAISLTRHMNNPFAFGDGGHENSLTGRLTWTPFFDEPSHGRYMMHLGIGAQYSGTNDGRLRIRARNSVRNGASPFLSNIVDTGSLLGNSQAIIMPEFAVVYGPWLFQSEYAASFLDGAATLAGAPINGGRMFTQAYYAEVLYFLTGEHREYERKQAAFGRVVPYENFYCVRAMGGGRCVSRGAWQVGLRYNVIDLRDGGFNGGYGQDMTVGLNWFLNPNMKIQWNYVLAGRVAPTGGQGTDGTYNGFGMRVAHDF
ncbi:MAG: hypothetical protein JNM18_18915 [Planctomycetaceae bacterium]|nr:hypothetical protein [Planctomycetaceae bacterium]